MNQDTINELRKAADYIKSGDTKSARKIIIEILRAEPENVQAWYMLSFSVPRTDKQIYALQQVLTLDPNHEKAINRILKLGGTPEPLPPQQTESPSKETPKEDIPEIKKPAEPATPEVDLLTQRLLGGSASDIGKDMPSTQSQSTRPAITSSFIETETEEEPESEVELDSAENAPETNLKQQILKVFNLPKRTLYLSLAVVAFIVIAALAITFRSSIANLFSSQPSALSDSTTSESSDTAGDVLPTPTVQATPTSIPPTSTPLPSPTPTPFSFSTTDLQSPSEATSAEMLEIQDQLISQLALSDDFSIDSYSVADSRLQAFLWDFDKLPGMSENIKTLQTFYTIFGLAQPSDDYKSFYSNFWIDPNGTLFLPDENLIAITGFEFSDYQKFSYAQAYVQSIRNSQYPFETFSVYPPCNLMDQVCEANIAFIKGEAAFQAMVWARNQMDADSLQDINETTKKVYFAPVQPATNIMEQIRLFPYEFGYSFVEAVFESGGQAAVNALFESPPTTTEQILHPEKFISGEGAALVDSMDISTLIPSDYTALFTGSFGEWKSRLMLAYGIEEKTRIVLDDAVTAASGWGGDYMQIYQNTAAETAMVGHWTFDTLDDTQEFYQAIDNYSANLISGFIVEIAGHTCLTAEKTSCLVTKDADVIWFLTTDQGLMERLLTNYTFLQE